MTSWRVFFSTAFTASSNLCCFKVSFHNKSALILSMRYLWRSDRSVGEIAQLYFHLWFCHSPWQDLNWTIYHIDYNFCCLWSLSYFIVCLIIQNFPKANCSCIKTIKHCHPELDWSYLYCTDNFWMLQLGTSTSSWACMDEVRWEW